MIKDKKVKQRMKFNNFVYHMCYLYSNFAGRLEKNECCPELPSYVSVFTPSACFVYFSIKQKI